MSQSVVVVSHWHHSAENFRIGPREFYDLIEQDLRESCPPEVRIERVNWHEGGLVSAKREYLRVGYGRFAFDVCAAPFGTGYFWSWWLVRRRPTLGAIMGLAALASIPALFLALWSAFGVYKGSLYFLAVLAVALFVVRHANEWGLPEIEDAVLSAPVIGSFYERFVAPETYYSVDTRTMFEESIQRVVARAVDRCLTVGGLQALSPAQAQPKARAPR